MLPDRCLSVLSVTLTYCGQMVGWIKMKRGMQVGLGPGHIVLNGDPAPLPQKGKRGQSPQFSAHICSGEMAGWMKMPLGREVGLSPSDIVLDEDPAPLPKKGAQPPIFGRCLLGPNGCMDQDATWHRARSRPGHIVLDGDPARPLPKERKGKVEYLYSAFLHQGTHKVLRHGSHSFTCKQHHACLSFVRIHQMSPPQQLRQHTSNCSSLLIYRP